MRMTKKDEIKLSKFDVIDFLDDGETVIAFLRLAIAEGDEDFIAKAIKDVARGYDKVKGENKKLKEQLEIARIVLGQIAMFSSDKADAIQCAKAIKDMSEVKE